MPPVPRTAPEASRLQVLKLLQASLSQRQLAAELGVSLGKANYCLRALAEKLLEQKLISIGKPFGFSHP